MGKAGIAQSLHMSKIYNWQAKFSKRNYDGLCCSSSDTYSVLEVCPPAVVHASATSLCITHMKLVPGLLIVLQAGETWE